MSRRWCFVALLGTLSGTAGCRREGNAEAASAMRVELASREGRLSRRQADTSGAGGGAPLAQWMLPGSLGEVSGLAIMSDGRLLAHDDESARVTVLDPRRGTLLKTFYVGNHGTKGDFEGIAVAGDVIYLMTSKGVLYAFREGADRADVKYAMHDTKLGKECEFEGVAHDPTANQLVMACKHVGDKDLKDYLVLYRVALPIAASPEITRQTISLEQLRTTHQWKGLHPTDLARDPATGNYVMVAALERALIEITTDGSVVQAIPLPGKHGQAEGVAITSDGVLIISDEARAKAATITLYRWPLADTSAARS